MHKKMQTQNLFKLNDCKKKLISAYRHEKQILFKSRTDNGDMPKLIF